LKAGHPAGQTTGTTADWRRILPVIMIVCTYSAGTAAVLPVLPFLVRSMGGSPLVLGIVIAAEAIGQFASAPALGQLSDRLGRKRVLMMSQAVAATSLLLLAFAPGVPFVLLARVLFGLTVGNVSVTAAHVADHTDAGSRRQAMGFLMAGAGLGGIVGAGLSGFLSDVSLKAPILAALGLVTVSTVVTKLCLKDGQTATAPGGRRQAGAAPFRAIAASPAIRILVIVMLCHFLAYGMYISQLPVFLGETFVWNGHAFGAREFSHLLIADGAINILVQTLLLGRLERHLTERSQILLIFALIGTGFVTAGLATTIPALTLAVLCISTGDALAKPTYLAALSMHIPPQRQGIVLGTAQSLIAAADVVSPVLAGFVLGYALYGVWIGSAVTMAAVGAVIAATRLRAAVHG
jgi:DHA1 family tetracycline resistance protein-like MFS transporter